MVLEGSFPLSPQQRRIWSLQQNDRSSPYRVQAVVLIEGDLDLGVLRNSLLEVTGRHDIYRTAFRSVAGGNGPVQVSLDDASLRSGREQSHADEIAEASIITYDLSGWACREQEARIEALCREDRTLAFDFERGLLAHVSLVALAADRHMLLVTMSALRADIVSLTLLLQEIGLAYAERSCGDLKRGPLREDRRDAPWQYAILAEWQNGILASADADAGRDYWRRQDLALVPNLPGEDKSSAAGEFQPRLLRTTVAIDKLELIEAAARKYGVSLSSFLLSCWQILLSRFNSGADFIIGTAGDGRTYEGLEDVQGPLLKYLPLRCHPESTLQFQQILRSVHEETLEGLEWQEYFTWEGAAESKENTQQAFFAACFDFQKAPAKHSSAGLTFAVGELYSCSDRFKLKLSCHLGEGVLTTDLHYDSSLFRAADIGRLSDQFQTLIGSALANPQSPIGDLEILSGTQRQQLLVEFNATRRDRSHDKCVHQLFEDQAARTPNDVAIAFEHRRLTYRELNTRINQLANCLQTLGVRAGVSVALCMERCPEIVIGVLGVLKAGGCYVPIDPLSPDDRRAFILRDSDAAVLLTQERLSKGIAKFGGQVICMDSGWNTIAQHDDANPKNQAGSKDAAYVIYTSGSTGPPKGVIVEHGGLTNAIDWISRTLELTADDRCFLKTPITFDAAGRELYPTLLAGGTLVIAEPGREGDCGYLLDLMRGEEISILHCVPSLLQVMVEQPSFDGTLRLRAVMCGGEALTAPLAKRFQSRSKARLYNVYGPTEATIDATFWLCNQIGPGDSVPIGRPIPNCQIYILDNLLGLVPIGIPGNLYIGGAGLARGYLNRPELTAAQFIPHPYSCEPGARLYRTGDLARHLPDGNIEFIGRIDHQVKIRGYRIELGEIESELARHPAVRDAVVVAHEEASGERRLVAYYVAEPDQTSTVTSLRTFLQERLPEYMVPAIFVLLEALPLTANGKVNRSALPAPDGARPDLAGAYEAPRSLTEEVLAEIWAGVLGVQRVGIHDDFFHLGGHSLLAMQVVTRMREAFKVDLPLRRIFELPTVAGLAREIDLIARHGSLAEPLSISPIPRGEKLPLSFAQQRLWFIDQLDPGNPVYNFPAAVRLIGPLDLPALTNSLNEVVGRHEALRTTFAIVDGAPVQVIAPTLRIDLPVRDLRMLPAAEREAAMLRMATEEARRPFDLSIRTSITNHFAGAGRSGLRRTAHDAPYRLGRLVGWRVDPRNGPVVRGFFGREISSVACSNDSVCGLCSLAEGVLAG